MSAGVYNFTIEQGTTFSTTIQILLPSTSPRDLTDYSARGQIRESADATTAVAEFDCSIDDPEEGKITISLSPEASTAIPTTGKSYSSLVKLVYDIEIYKALEGELEEVFRVLNGYVYLSPEVTRE